MMEALATEIKERALDFAEDWSRGPPVFFAIIDCTVEREFDSIMTRDVHLMSKNDVIFQGNGFNRIRRVVD